MRKEIVNKLPLGFYKIYWDSGGSSSACVGMKSNGDRWLAPANWVTPSTDFDDWLSVKKAVHINGIRKGETYEGD